MKPKTRTLLFFLSFLSGFILFVSSLAPTVTFEDSGELISAAFTAGVPHEPGYPLFTILGKLFSFLPVGNVAYRINLMSAFFSALAMGVISLFSFELLTLLSGSFRLFGNVSEKNKALALGLISFGAAVIAGAGVSYFDQSIIAEVYAINNLCTSLLMLLALKWYIRIQPTQLKITDRRLDRKLGFLFYAYCLICGISLSNHHTSLVFIPLGFLMIWIADRSYLMDVKRIVLGICFLALGLLPYLYLPVAAGRHPDMNWGDAENWTNFWRVIERHQYSFDQPRTLALVFAQWKLHWVLLYEEFTLFPLLLVALGFLVLCRFNRKLFYYSLLFYFFTGPLVANVLNFNLLSARSKELYDEMKGTIEVFYLPLYLYLSGMMSLGILFVADRLNQLSQAKKGSKPGIYLWAGSLLAVFAFCFALVNRKTEDMSRYRFTEKYAGNLMKLCGSNALVLCNWDPFSFPMIYYQRVEHKANGVYVVDVEMMRRTWYIQMLRKWYPDLMGQVAGQTDAFLETVKHFEDGTFYDARDLQEKYVSMIRSIIDLAGQHMPVYATVFPLMRPLEQDLVQGYTLEPYGVAYKLTKDQGKINAIDYAAFDYSGFDVKGGPKDRMANMIQNYYAMLFLLRANMLETIDRAAALQLYQKGIELEGNEVIKARAIGRMNGLK